MCRIKKKLTFEKPRLGDYSIVWPSNWCNFEMYALLSFANDTFGSLGSPFSKSACFVKFWYAKWNWSQFSHNVFILGLFRIANLYWMPRVTVFTSGSEIDTSKYLVHSLTIPTSFTQFGSIYLQIYTFYPKQLFETGFWTSHKPWLERSVSQNL